jgi:hypothetical protein
MNSASDVPSQPPRIAPTLVDLTSMPRTPGVATDVAARGAVAEDGRARAREASLDFVKGALVMVMVLYHWLNYFVGLDWGGYKYLRFLTPGFIFITGYLISHAYLARFSYDDPRLHRRLWWRGTKLLVLFVVLNILVDQTPAGRLHLTSSAAAAFAAARGAFLLGDGWAAFDILVSIAYLLLLAPLVLLTSQRLHVSVSAIAVVAVIVVAGWSLTGWSNPHLEMLSVGVLGLAAGIRTSRLETVLRSPVVLALSYVMYTAAITIWNEIFPLQVVSVVLSLLLIHVIASSWGTNGAIQASVIRMGQYSLFSYIVQIAILQLLRVAFRAVPLAGFTTLAPLALALIATVLAVEGAAFLRARSAVLDRTYRVVFA